MFTKSCALCPLVYTFEMKKRYYQNDNIKTYCDGWEVTRPVLLHMWCTLTDLNRLHIQPKSAPCQGLFLCLTTRRYNEFQLRFFLCFVYDLGLFHLSALLSFWTLLSTKKTLGYVKQSAGFYDFSAPYRMVKQIKIFFIFSSSRGFD